MQACLRFRLGHEWYALPVKNVDEVVSLVAITPLPEAPPHVLGVIIVQGAAVTVIDLRRLLGHALSPLQLSTPLLILKAEAGSPLAVLVDEIDNVVALPDDLETVSSGSDLVAGITRFSEASLLMLRPAALFSAGRVRG